MTDTTATKPTITERIAMVAARHNKGTLHGAVYRWSGGRLGARMRGVPTLLLTTTGRRTGQSRTRPLMYHSLDTGWAVAASDSGADTPPAWFQNLEADPHATVQVGRRHAEVRARTVADDGERARLWEAMCRTNRLWHHYQAMTDRTIAVVVLEPVA